MKCFKRGICFLLSAVFFLSCNTGMTIAAEAVGNEPTIYYEDDFETNYMLDETEIHMNKANLYAPDALSNINMGNAANGGQITRQVEEDGNGFLKATSAKRTDLEISKMVNPVPRGKIVMEFRYRRTNPTYGNAFNFAAAGEKICYIVRTGATEETIFTDSTKSVPVAIVNFGQWHTITIIYDDVNTTRTILVDGVNKAVGTANKYPATAPMNFRFAWNIEGATATPIPSEIHLDYLKVYSYPQNTTIDVQNAQNTEFDFLDLNLGFIPDGSTMTPENIKLKDSGINVTSVEVSPKDIRKYKVKFDQPLAKDTEYTLEAENVKDLEDSLISLETKFKTRKGYLYASDISLNSGDSEIDSLSPDTYKLNASIQNETVNEQEPTIYAVYYQADNGMKNFTEKKFPVSAESIVREDSEFQITDEVADNEVLKLFSWKEAEIPIPISSVVSYSKDGKNRTPYGMLVPDYTGIWDVDTQIDRDSSILTVTVDTKDTGTIREVGLMIKPKPTEENQKTVPSYINQKKTENGKATFEFYLAGDDGPNYSLVTGINGAAQCQSLDLDYYNSGYFEKGIENFNNADNKTKVDSLIAEYKPSFGFDTAIYDSLGEKIQPAVCTYILKMREDLEDGKFISIGQINDVFNQACLLGKIYDKKDVAQVLEDQKDKFGLKKEIFELYQSNLSDTARKYVVDQIGGNEYDTPKVLSEYFTKQVILGGIYKSENYKQTRKIIKDTIGYTLISLDDYEKLKNPDPVDNGMTRQLFADFFEMKSKFDELVTTQKSYEDNNKGDSGSTSGGSSSSGSGPVIDFKPTPTPAPVPTPTPTPVPTQSPVGFTDMQGYEWASTAVNALSEKGVLKGVKEGKFAPGNQVTRAEFIKMIVTAFDITGGEGSEVFSDVGKNDWYYSFVNTAYKNGIVSGLSETEFGPNEPLSREMAATILYKAGKLKEKNFSKKSDGYVDMNSVDSYAYDAVAYLSGAGIISGYEDGTVRPKDLCDRAQAAQIVYGLLQYNK